jgi:hypothetical protein
LKAIFAGDLGLLSRQLSREEDPLEEFLALDDHETTVCATSSPGNDWNGVEVKFTHNGVRVLANRAVEFPVRVKCVLESGSLFNLVFERNTDLFGSGYALQLPGRCNVELLDVTEKLYKAIKAEDHIVMSVFDRESMSIRGHCQMVRELGQKRIAKIEAVKSLVRTRQERKRGREK